ncbi:rho guanine nucleotide exchange factor 18 isoform X4 [Phlebotomus papatasi]|uniref:rho guanine nucleotide exchange factor 18 isoform X4 n=1 Tax=Phlebotomus papatasi TaxID=29031 RepID=UPI0024837B58|nr:rho guanine nucleotide exchange factor 18 isoform X4 [Phlebotomus papatasi]
MVREGRKVAGKNPQVVKKRLKFPPFLELCNTMFSTERLVQMSSDDDSDVDLVVDYLSMNKDVENSTQTQDVNSVQGKSGTGEQRQNKCSVRIKNNLNNNNMVPIISVTPHSPGAKYSGILEDPLNQLQCIRESLMQMKNPGIHNQTFGAANFANSLMQSSRLFSSCPSLPDLSMATANSNNMWPAQTAMYGLNTDRRKSWTAIEDLTECAKNSNKSASLSSVDSEESLRAADRLQNRGSRNSTGGISTHSLNEAELARDFERILAKRNLAPIICRIPLQKSISTPSIAPVRSQNAKEEKTVPTSRHLSDSEDENQDDRSLLSVRDKNEVYADHPEKRRKRGSLFFRKKKDKAKAKGQSTNCDVCGAVINLSSYKEHAIECKAKIAKSQHGGKSGSGKKSSSNSHGTSHQDNHSRDYYELHGQGDHINYSDDTPLIRDEFLYDPPIGPHDLGADPILGMAIDEPDSWSPSVPREVVKSLKDKQVKRQEHIYEFIMTEKTHCQNLLVMQKVFVESLQRHFNHLNLERMFPCLPELIDLHTSFLRKLKVKQRESYIVDSIVDIMLDFFSGLSAQRLKNAYGEFCSNHRSALETFKCYMTEDHTFSEWYKHCQTNPLLKKKGIPECILFVTQRLTKYPLLIDPLLKSSREDKIEQEKLQKAMSLVKEILVDVDARVADKDKEERQLSIFKKIDAKSYAIYKEDKFKKSDIINANRKLKFEGVATLMQGRSKMQTVLVVVLSDCLFFLQENSHKYTFFTPENKAGVVSLQKLLIREKAGTESRGIYIISSNPTYPEMYELKVQNPKDKNIWIQAIRAAVLDCPSDELEPDMTVEQKQKLIDARQANVREIIYKLRQKDLEQAMILEEKIALQLSLWLDSQNAGEGGNQMGADEFLANFGSYRELVTDDCDTIEIWKRVLYTVQEIGQLAATLYSAATGLPLSRSFSSVGEKHSEMYISPTLPKRAETFGGFDERRNKQSNHPWRDAVLSTLPTGVIMGQKRDSMTSEVDSTLSPASQNSKCSSENVSIKDHNFAALQVSHNLHTLLCIISQQMTTIQSLQAQLMSFKDTSKNLYRHNDQLEEVRNLLDKLQEQKTEFMRYEKQRVTELDEREQRQKEELKKEWEHIRAEQEDIKQQREQLYRKMEILSNQGLLLSPNVALPVPGHVNHPDDGHSTPHLKDAESHADSQGVDRRKDKWRSSSTIAFFSTVSKTHPVTLLSATNAQKGGQTSVKQQLPLKLSSVSSTKSSTEKTNVSSSALTSPPSSNSANVTQMFPLKLADKKVPAASSVNSNHSRTGSSPAVIQQPLASHAGNPPLKTNTYPKIPERHRLRSTDGAFTSNSGGQATVVQQQRSMSVYAQLPSTVTPPQPPPRPAAREQPPPTTEEEVIYF